MDAVGASQGRDQVDATVFRDTLARVPTPVTVVTSHVDRRPHGTTVSAFSSLSLEPPMILISLDQRSTWYPDEQVRYGQLMLWWLDLATILGWLLSSVFVLSLARLSRNN